LVWVITRRTFLKNALLTAGLARAIPHALAKAAQPRTAVNFEVPAGGCDCHVHVFDPEHFAYSPARVYTPESATLEELQALHRALHVERTIVVQPSVYGTDNACLLGALGQLGHRARGVAVIDERASEAALDDMARAGVRGIRLNLATGGVPDPAVARQRFQAGAERVKARGWHIQIYAPTALVAAIGDLVLASPVPVVFDHFGGALAARGLQQPGFGVLVDLVRSGQAYVKISGTAELVSGEPPTYADVAPLARALVAANPQRILWATNWPHPDSARVPGRRPTDLAPLFPTDDGRVFDLLPTWVPEASVRRTILVENPARLYGF